MAERMLTIAATSNASINVNPGAHRDRVNGPSTVGYDRTACGPSVRKRAYGWSSSNGFLGGESNVTICPYICPTT